MKMRRHNLIKTVVSVLLLAAITLSVSCGSIVPGSGVVDLMKGIKANSLPAAPQPSRESSAKAADFGLRLFRAARDEGNTLVSPLSVLFALSMTANGAKAETLEQIESVLGMSLDELNEFCRGYAACLPNGNKYKLNLANSIWFTSDERFTVNKDFLQTNADYYGADAYKAPFDETTLRDINAWVKKNTDGMIPNVLDKIPGNAVMYLINALAFDAEWEWVYEKHAVSEGNFICEDGSKKVVDFMHGSENQYLKTDNAQGFIKYYKDRKYAFAALLPDEGVSVEELIDSIDGEKLMEILSGAEDKMVITAIPEFECEYSTTLNDALSSMGMPKAFDEFEAEFAGLGASTAGNIFISRVIHKTHVSVDERGTKAGAATVIEMADGDLPLNGPIVELNRPFVYMLIDCETNLPFFIGTLMEP